MDIQVGEQRFTPSRIFCIGRNYAAHAAELGNVVPTAPVVFMKPASALVPPAGEIVYPGHGADLQHEAEVVVMIGAAGRVERLEDARAAIAGLGMGLDLTLRDVQSALKNQGLPWEAAKAFDASAPLGPLVPLDAAHDLAALRFTCSVDGELRQRGDTGLMLFPIVRLLVELSAIWSLLPGDLIYTGTPAGVGPLQRGQTVTIEADFCASSAWTVV